MALDVEMADSIPPGLYNAEPEHALSMGISIIARFENSRLAFVTKSNEVHVLDCADKDAMKFVLSKKFKKVKSTITAIAEVSQTEIALGLETGEVRVFDLTRQKRSVGLQGPNQAVTSLLLLEGRKIAASIGRSLLIWDIDTKTRTNFRYPFVHSQDIVALEGNPHGIVSCSFDGTITVWNDSGKPVATLRIRHPVLATAILTPQGEAPLIAMASLNKTVGLWSSQTGEWRVVADNLEVTALTNIGKGYFATGENSGLVRIWDAKTMACVQILNGDKEQEGKVQSLVALSNGTLIARWEDGIAVVWCAP